MDTNMAVFLFVIKNLAGEAVLAKATLISTTEWYF